MKSADGFWGRAIPNAKEVLAPKKRWKVMFVAGSVKEDVIGVGASSSALMGGKRRRQRRSVERVMEIMIRREVSSEWLILGVYFK